MKKYTYSKQSIDIKDIYSVIKTLRSPRLTQGSKVKDFEDAICQYTGAKYAVAVSHGTDALHLAVATLNLNPNDEVITSPNTFIATANAVLYAGAKVKFADIHEINGCIDTNEIAKLINPNTKAIIPVHFAGHVCDMQLIHDLALKHNLKVIEDGAHALGSSCSYDNNNEIKIGACYGSDMTIFSFHPVKPITTGEGGMITTNDKETYFKLLHLRSHGTFKKSYMPSWYYDMEMLGYNYRLTDIQASLGCSQLKKLDQFINRRREIAEQYKYAFKFNSKYNYLYEPTWSRSSYHLFPLLINFNQMCKTKSQLFNTLLDKGIQCQVHYRPVYHNQYYIQNGHIATHCPKAEKYYYKTLSIPIYPDLTNKDIKKIIKIIKTT